jgi:enterochelin esterase-like enzyme
MNKHSGIALCCLFPLIFIASGMRCATSGSAQEPVESPTIRSLSEKAAAKDSHAVEAFWSRVQGSGPPLVEPIPEKPNYSLVTFLWRADNATHNVVVVSPLALMNFPVAEMKQIPETDVWYLTYTMRNDARMVYRYSPNDSLVPFDAETNFYARMANFRRDPFNTKTFDYGNNMLASVLELPDAPSDRWIQVRADIPHGTLKQSKISSAILKNDLSVRLYTPPNFVANDSYPLVMVMDGDSYTTLVPTPTILDNLIHDGKIPAVVALFVGNSSPQARDNELNCADAWGDFLAKEAIPWIGSTMNIRVNANGVSIAGSSMGGLAAACAAYQHPEIFGKVLAQSGSFYRTRSDGEPEWLTRQFVRAKPLPIDFYLEVGLLETSAIPSRDPSMLTSSRHLRDVLMAKGYRVDYHEHFSGHEHVAWRATLGEGLIELIGSTRSSR